MQDRIVHATVATRMRSNRIVQDLQDRIVQGFGDGKKKKEKKAVQCVCEVDEVRS